MASFATRHLGCTSDDEQKLSKLLGFSSAAEVARAAVPAAIRSPSRLTLSRFPAALSENDATKALKEVASHNKVARSFIGQGYYGTITPPPIQRGILENPSWYTPYTPYQPEISQGRLEALLNFQTMVSELTALPVANASLLDEGGAAAEALSLSLSVAEKEGRPGRVAFLSSNLHPQTVAVVSTRARGLGVTVEIGSEAHFVPSPKYLALFLQYPDTFGVVFDHQALATAARGAGVTVIVATDLLALTVLTPPGVWGADIALGSAQRFGVPMGGGGPHAAFFAAREEYTRLLPGRIVGVSVDTRGRRALRLSLQTREQHIRREKATSNICTAQALLATIASMYAVYHGPKGLQSIGEGVHRKAVRLAAAARAGGWRLRSPLLFDTLCLEASESARSSLQQRALALTINLGFRDDGSVVIALDEATTEGELATLSALLGGPLPAEVPSPIPAPLRRQTPPLTHEIFSRYHTETELMRYMKRLERRDLSLADAMIPLGSCTMKLNAAAEMYPVTWPEFGAIHPFAPAEQQRGFSQLFADLEVSLAEITGFDAVSLQPNSGAMGEYAGLLAIRGYLDARGETARTVCLIPTSAHGTNPASAVMAGFDVVVVKCDTEGNVDIADLRTKIAAHEDRVGAMMITYPSTHGVFEVGITEATALVHAAGGQVYMDGANLNAIVGLATPAAVGADVCHINLHKTFCIPHGGGGPGMGPIACRKHLAPYLPGHPQGTLARKDGAVSAAPYGSASILVIPWMYLAMMAGDGITRASEVAILNANYIAKRLEGAFPTLYRGAGGLVAHECILDLRGVKQSAGVEVDDIAKRLIDYGFHPPTVSWPVAGTIMVEPTESESRRELDRFCDALIAIRSEIRKVEAGEWPRDNNPLKHAPHTLTDIAAEQWARPYPRELGAFPSPHTREQKCWPTTNRIDAAYGDRNFVCTCPPLDSYT